MKNPQYVEIARRQIEMVLKYNPPRVEAPRTDRHGTSEAEEFEDMVRRLSPAERERFLSMLNAG